MSDLKPIVPGCLCMVISSSCGNEGIVLTVIKRMPCPLGFVDGVYWETDRVIMSLHGLPMNCIQEFRLMRIDGHDEQDTETNKELELTE